MEYVSLTVKFEIVSLIAAKHSVAQACSYLVSAVEAGTLTPTIAFAYTHPKQSEIVSIC